MVKRQNENDGNRPLARVRYFELEGSDETIQKALSTFERMRNPAYLPPPPAKRLAPTNSPSREPTLFEDEDDVIDAEVGTGSAEVSENDPNGQRRKRGDGPSVDRNAGITAAGDVDFYPNGKTSLKDFFAEKSPGSDMERCLVFSFYMQEVVMISPFGAGHLLAGFNNVGAEIPKDLPGTLRNMREGKKRSKAWLAFSDLDNIRVTTNGLNHVRHELGKDGGENGGDK
jgi:hypothetical protein